MDLVLKGCENSRKTSNPSISYIDGILTSWFEKGIKSVEEIEEKDKLPEKIEKNKSYKVSTKKATPNKFHNFQQRTKNYTAEELEEIARRKRAEYYFKQKGVTNDV